MVWAQLTAALIFGTMQITTALFAATGRRCRWDSHPVVHSHAQGEPGDLYVLLPFGAWLLFLHLAVSTKEGLLWLRLACAVGASIPLHFWLVKESIRDRSPRVWLRKCDAAQLGLVGGDDRPHGDSIHGFFHSRPLHRGTSRPQLGLLWLLGVDLASTRCSCCRHVIERPGGYPEGAGSNYRCG